MMAHILAILFFVLQVGGVTTSPEAPPKLASIEGKVVRLSNGEPLRRAQLTLSQVPSPAELAAASPDNTPRQFPSIPPITTEADGKFNFTKLTPGTYRLTVACNGYVTTEYGKTTAAAQGTIITLTPGQAMKDILLTLQASALVTGHVRDSEGEPITGVVVSLMKPGYSPNGVRILSSSASATTDDRGEYRLFWVTPGHYYLSTGGEFGLVQMLNRGANMVETINYIQTYFPGTLDQSRAVLIDIQAGQELSALDIAVPKLPTYRVKGSVVEAANGKPPKSANVFLAPRNETALLQNVVNSALYGSYVNGDFEFSNVIPGSYWLRANSGLDYDALLPADVVAGVRTTSDLFEAAFNRGLSGELPVEITTSDVTGLKISMTSGARVLLHVTMDGQELPAVKDFERIRFNLIDQTSPQGIQRGPLTANGAGGDGVMENVADGKYRIQLNTQNNQNLSTLFIKEAHIDDTDVLNGYWQLSGTPKGTLRVVLSDKAGRVEGNLSDATSKPVAGMQVVLVPEKTKFRTELYDSVDSDEKGHFTFRSVPPGDYRVFAWEDLEPYSYYDPEVMKPYEQQGKLVHVTEASQQSIEIKLIPAPKN